ncbi:MAG: hypothetical protein ACXW3O_16385, partial [Brevundimonas sp.]
MALIDPHHRSLEQPDRTPLQQTAEEVTTVNRRSLANSSLLQAEIVAISNLGPDGVPLISGSQPIALIPVSGSLYLEWDAGAVWMDLNQV